jgi:NADH-quinone oxidoreductase subunit N
MLSGYLALTPEIGLIILAAIVLVFGRQPVGERRRQVGLLTAWGTAIILAYTLALWYFFDQPSVIPVQLWGDMFRHDMVTLVFRVMFLSAALITSLLTVDVKRLQHGEFYALILLATVGFNLMAAASDLILLYLALETASISFYVLAGFATDSRRSPEAGIKYFVYGAFASGVMLYGLSLLYGYTALVGGPAGATNIYNIAAVVRTGSNNPFVLLAAVMVIVGFGFKISAVPFHFWAPDVYEGAPTSVTTILSTASKAAGFAVFLRVFSAGAVGLPNQENWWSILVSMAIASMTLGNLAAIYQSNIKRMSAYSSVAQAGYVLIGLISFNTDGSGAGAAMFYLLMYVFTNAAAFGVVIVVSNISGGDEMSDFYGLSRRSPWLAIVMLLALLSLGGIPPTAGFFAKFFLFKAAIDAGLWWLAFIGILNAFVALYYYLNVVKYLYLYRSDSEETPITLSRAAQLGLALATLGVIYLGVWPNAIYEWTTQAARAFF